MATNSGDLVRTLIEGGLAPQSARAIANAIANADSPTFSKGGDISDATPTEQLRLITADTRRYQLTNLDFSPAAPFQERLDSNPGQYAGPPADHPYKDSQPVTSAPPLSAPRVQAADYLQVDNEVDGNSAVSRVGLRLRQDTGRHLRIDPSTKFLDALPFLANSQSGQFLSADFQETEEGTQLLVSLRNLEQVNLQLANGDTRQAFVFPEADAAGPAGDAAGATRSLEAVDVTLANGQTRQLYAYPKAAAVTPAAGLPVLQCRAFAVFDGAQAGANPKFIPAITAANIAAIYQTATGNYTLGFAAAMPSTNYLVLITASQNGTNRSAFGVLQHETALTTANFHIATFDDGGTIFNCKRVNVAVFL